MDVVHVTDQLLERFKTLATPTLANALDDVAFEGVLVGLAQMVPGTRCVGRAMTVREVTGRRGDFASEDFKKVGDVIDACRPGEVLVIDNGGHCVSTFGGLATLAAKLKGIAGLVGDGGVRDREEMVEHALSRVRAAHDAAHGTHAARGRRHQRACELRRRARAARRRHRRRRVGRGVHPRRACGQGRRAGGGLRRDDARPPPSSRKGLTFSAAMAKFRRI